MLTSHDLDGRERLDVITPILFAGQQVIGSVHVGFSKRPIYETVAQSQKKIRLFILLALCVGLLGAWLLAYVIVKPIRRLVQGVKAITEGDFPQIQMKSNDEIGLLVSNFNEMSRNLREKELIKRAFTQYVSENILESFLQNPKTLQLGGTRTEATILFTDVRNFTALAEQLEPSEVVHILNDYFAAVVEVVQKYEGTLDKFMGDAVMAVFGTPVRHENDEERAVRAAIEMNERFQLLKQKWIREGYPEIEIGIGINTGEVIAGNVGTLQRLAYTVIGNSVNMAARIEKLNKRYHTQILISASTYKRLESILDAIPLPPTRVRGKSEEIQVYVVVGFRTDSLFRKKTLNSALNSTNSSKLSEVLFESVLPFCPLGGNSVYFLRLFLS
ncbi:MAG: HAMP domain-containing protein [Candidatus Manganitrophus sp.]|nr:MAG: HAMP domain-containing protein [Candidatus Manganitrophus sp.]